MRKETIKKIVNLFKKYPVIKLAYLFGSQVSGETGPLSDYDLAIYTIEEDKEKNFYLKLEIIGKLTNLLKTNAIDLVILNEVDNSELKYNIIKEGQLIYEEEPYRILVEPKILNQYFDFRQSLLRNFR